MRINRSCHRFENLLVSCLAISGLLLVLPHVAFGKPASDFLNQGSPDFSAPQRYRLNGSWEIGGIWLSREAPDSQDIVFDDNDNVLLNADQLQGGMGGGLDTTLNLFNLFNRFSTHNALDFQMRFFQAGDMVANETVTGASVVPVFFQGIPVNPTISSVANYETKIRSFESNLMVRTPYRIQLLAGFRFFEVDETFNYFTQESGSGTTIFESRSRAENTMAGGQVGAEGTILSKGFSRIFGSCKWALLNNDIVGTANALDAAGDPLQTDARDSIVSQLLDFQLGGSLSLPYVSLYASYQGLIASDIALSLEQNRNASLFVSSNPIYTSDAQWHGFKLTGTLAW